ncbi:MAG: N-acetyltransferase family protein [Alphaproteobacteria bacterium]|nr:MAG: N-acetyltransferase family protein [Alphaproteobacteria bacterium]
MTAPTPVTVRSSRPEDIRAITEIYGYNVLHALGTFEVVAPDEMEMTARRNAILELGLPYLVAEQDGTILGYAYAGQYRPRPAYRNTVENSVYVREGMRGKGVGKLLLAAVIEACRAAGKKQMIAVIGDSGNAGSIGLHSALGFRMVGVFENVGYKHDRWVDTVLMQKSLDEES